MPISSKVLFTPTHVCDFPCVAPIKTQWIFIKQFLFFFRELCRGPGGKAIDVEVSSSYGVLCSFKYCESYSLRKDDFDMIPSHKNLRAFPKKQIQQTSVS